MIRDFGETKYEDLVMKEYSKKILTKISPTFFFDQDLKKNIGDQKISRNLNFFQNLKISKFSQNLEIFSKIWKYLKKKIEEHVKKYILKQSRKFQQLIFFDGHVILLKRDLGNFQQLIIYIYIYIYFFFRGM